MRTQLIAFCVATLQMSLFVTPAFSSGEWDVQPTPLDEMEEAGVPIDADAISGILSDTSQDAWFRFPKLQKNYRSDMMRSETKPKVIPIFPQLRLKLRRCRFSSVKPIK